MEREAVNKALLISENHRQLGQMRLLLERAGYAVMTADAGTAFALAQSESPDIIISEVGTQPIESLDICRRMRAYAGLGATPILLIIDRRHPERLAAELQAEADDYLEAPFEALRLVSKVAQLIERRRTREAVGASQARLAGIVDSAMDAIITADGGQRIILFNAAAERMFRCPAAAALGQPLARFIPARFRSKHADHVRAFGQTGTTTRAMAGSRAVYGLRADGSEFPIEASISQIDAGGQKLFTVIMRDISERLRAEAALHASEARFSIAFNVSPISSVIATLDEDRYVAVNDTFLSLTGYSREEVIGRTSADLSIWPTPQARVETISRLKREGQVRNREMVYRMKTGALRTFLSSAEIIELDGQPHLITASIDITERKQAEEEVRRLNEELEQRVAKRTAQLQAANHELEAFSYSVSHDLRAPLRHINGFSQALLEDYADRLDDQGKGYLQELRDASREMAHLIDDLLQLARVTRSEMRSETVSLSEVAQAVIADLRKRDAGRNVRVQVADGLVTHGDKRLLQVMLGNLLGNAWKFTARREQAEITFDQTRQGGEAVYFVRDNGAGFDMAYVNKLFGAFQRLHNGKEFEGTGIGLATVQRIVRRHGGRVWAEGQVNEGATFYFTLADFREHRDGEESDLTG